jgi:nickel/cobalt transporter (NicO) family protein
MLEGLLYLVTSFWLGAVHAATPGHGKTIAASYIVGARGRPVDALVLGIFVTLSHTSGIILVAALATLGSAWLIPQRVEAYLAVGTGILVIGIGGWMLWTQIQQMMVGRALGHAHGGVDAPHGASTPADNAHAHDHSHDHGHNHPHAHSAHYHRHGWGPVHTHDLEAIAQARPRLAVLLSAIASGKLILGLSTVVVFSLGFASVLVLVGVVAARVGQLVLAWLESRWINGVQIGAALLIAGVGVVLTARALRTVASLW